jgi:hypothetical protein
VWRRWRMALTSSRLRREALLRKEIALLHHRLSLKSTLVNWQQVSPSQMLCHVTTRLALCLACMFRVGTDNASDT